MGKKLRIQLAPGDRDRLEVLIANGNTPQEHVRRARIVLLAGDGVDTDEFQRRLAVSKPTIRRLCRAPNSGWATQGTRAVVARGLSGQSTAGFGKTR